MEGQEMPVGWAMATVGELTNVGPKNECADATEVGFVPLQRLGVTYLSRPTHEPRAWKDVKKGYTQFQNGDVLLARITPSFENGKAGIARDLPNGLGAGSTEYIVFRPFAEALDPRYLLAHFKTRSFLASGELVMTGAVGQQRVPKAFVLESQLPLAPLNEQRRIAAKLDITLATVDACRQRLDGVGAILKRFRLAVLAAATSGELTREWREERGLVWSPRQLTVGDLGAIVTGNTPKAVADDAEEVVPLFKPTELDAGYNVRHAKELMGPKRAQGARMLPPLTVLVTCIGATIGKTGLSRTAGATNQQINAIITNPKIATPQWIYFWFTSPVGQASIVDNASATTLPIINKSRFSALEVDVPDIEEQQEIVRLIESLFALAGQLEAKLTTAIRIVERLTPALLAKAFRGELVPQDPNDEPARVLLERIRVARQAEAGTEKPMRRGRRNTLAQSELSPLAPPPFSTNDPSRVILGRTGDETTQGERGPNRISKTKPSDDLKGWSPMKSLIQILEQHQGWISASKACEEMGISDGSSSEDLELFFRQLKEQVEGGSVYVQRRGNEDWLKLSSGEVV